MTYYTYLAIRGRISYTLNAKFVELCAKRCLSVLKTLVVFRLHHDHVRKDTSLSPSIQFVFWGSLGMRLMEPMVDLKGLDSLYFFFLLSNPAALIERIEELGAAICHNNSLSEPLSVAQPSLVSFYPPS